VITDAQLVVGQVRTQASDSVAKGVVISSSPAAGARVKEGTRVGLVVSSGPEKSAATAAPATVPEVVGLTVAQATAALQKAGLRAVAVDADGNPATAGTVVAAGSPKNKKVVLTVQAPQ
jgi:serine/threonine-protein kinase